MSVVGDLQRMLRLMPLPTEGRPQFEIAPVVLIEFRENRDRRRSVAAVRLDESTFGRKSHGRNSR
ncbi:hypothetical protein [Rhizobium mongolense]|uniref:Uncharacterized protein n=1 Tax=Rhizobium mongolense TaxID=57676 RepID=A0A7W6RST2_9HYPH|nr:hypothetical protein [Rhizobium mongolense]MBB4277989.1 hypothetical protein [Rhizobium mongolense]